MRSTRRNPFANGSTAETQIPRVGKCTRRPFTQRRQIKVQRFIESYMNDPKKFAACGSDSWFQELLEAVGEPGVVLLENVRHWVEINSEVFYIPPSKYQEIFGKLPKRVRNAVSPEITKKTRGRRKQRCSRKSTAAEAYYDKICKRLQVEQDAKSTEQNKEIDQNATEESLAQRPTLSVPTTLPAIPKLPKTLPSISPTYPAPPKLTAILPFPLRTVSIEEEDDDSLPPHLSPITPGSPIPSEVCSSDVSIISYCWNTQNPVNVDEITEYSFVTDEEASILQDNLTKYNFLIVRLDEIAKGFEEWRASLIVLNEPCRIEIIQRFNEIRSKFEYLETEHIRRILASRDYPDLPECDSGVASAENSNETVCNALLD